MDNPTPTPTPTTPAPAAPAATPSPIEKIDLSQLSEADRLALTQMASEFAKLKAAPPPKSNEPWYWNDYSKGVYTGLAGAALIVGTYFLYKKYTSAE